MAATRPVPAAHRQPGRDEPLVPPDRGHTDPRRHRHPTPIARPHPRDRHQHQRDQAEVTPTRKVARKVTRQVKTRTTRARIPQPTARIEPVPPPAQPTPPLATLLGLDLAGLLPLRHGAIVSDPRHPYGPNPSRVTRSAGPARRLAPRVVPTSPCTAGPSPRPRVAVRDPVPLPLPRRRPVAAPPGGGGAGFAAVSGDWGPVGYVRTPLSGSDRPWAAIRRRGPDSGCWDRFATRRGGVKRRAAGVSYSRATAAPLPR